MSIKSKIAIAALMAMSVASVNAMAAGKTGNSGKVTFSGEVVDSPCNLAPDQDGTDVKVHFGQLSMSQLNAGEKTAEKFVLKLQNCNLTVPASGQNPASTKTAEITFNSTQADATNHLMLPTGTATGLGIGIDGYVLGTAKALPGLVNGDNDLQFTAVAQQAATGTNVTAGTFEAIANFQISYH